MTFQPWSAQITNTKIVIDYRTSNCRTQGAANRMIGNIAVLTAAEHCSQVQASVCGNLLHVISNYQYRQVTAIVHFKISHYFRYIFRRTDCSLNVVGREQELWMTDVGELLHFKEWYCQYNYVSSCGQFCGGLQEMNNTCRRKCIWERWIEVSLYYIWYYCGCVHLYFIVNLPSSFWMACY